MAAFPFSKLISVWLIIGCATLLLAISNLTGASKAGETVRQKRSLFGFFGPPPLPGDQTGAAVCERYCRNNCLSGGFSGFMPVPGCNQFCDCRYYFGR